MGMVRYALVTGASSGLGNAITWQLANENYIVFAGIRKEADRMSFAAQQRIIPLQLDITKAQDIESAFGFIQEEVGEAGLSVLINNAGINYVTAFELSDETRENEVIDVNLLGMMRLTRKVMPLMHQYVQASGMKAKIINVSSMGGFFGLPWEAAYHASKFAVIGFSQSLAYELRQLNISVCCFIPGGMKTNIFQKSIINYSSNPIVSHTHAAFYARNIKHMQSVLEGFDRSAAPVAKAAKVIAKLLHRSVMPVKIYFGRDAHFVRALSWSGLQNVLAKRFLVR